MHQTTNGTRLLSYLRRRPQAYAEISGSSAYPNINGSVLFYQLNGGVLVVTEVNGLPQSRSGCGGNFFGYHIHGGSNCTGTNAEPFANAGAHYDIRGCAHPYHAGDLPPLLGADGYAFSAVLSNRFSVDEIYGKTVVIHAMRDDFHTQPSGDSGARIACGEIRK